MPIYEYRCDNEHRFEVLQKFADEALTVCEQCGAPARRVLHPVAIHFKGSGFYSTDYGRGKKSAAADSKTDSGESSSNSDSGGDSKKPADTGSSGGGESQKAAEG